MNSIQLRQTINHYLDQLSGDRLRLVADFLNFLVHTEHKDQSQVIYLAISTSSKATFRR